MQKPVNTTSEYSRETNSITFKVEDLEPPTLLLKEEPIEKIADLFGGHLEAKSPLPEKLVPFGYHAFIRGMYAAYADHRPFIISPDMIWTLILQGFSQHVNFNKGTAADVFPDLEGGTIEVLIRLNEKGEIPWDLATELFSKRIAEHIGEELVNAMRADFSTTGVVEKMVSEFIIMDSMKSYFKYILKTIICGIPEITLEGKKEDWEKLQKKMQVFRKYGLAWWIDRLEHPIRQCIAVYDNQKDIPFWRNMFKIHTENSYGKPEIMDGWILNFFPYTTKGQKLHTAKGEKGIYVRKIEETLPKEIACFDLKLIIESTGKTTQKLLQCWAGFVGLTQDETNFALRPTLGWLITPEAELSSQSTSHTQQSKSVKYYQIEEFPEELMSGSWEDVVLFFKQDIKFPNKAIEAEMLYFFGNYTKKDMQNLKRIYWLKNVYINIK